MGTQQAGLVDSEAGSPMRDQAGSGHKTSRKSGLKAMWGQVEKGLEIQADLSELCLDNETTLKVLEEGVELMQ